MSNDNSIANKIYESTRSKGENGMTIKQIRAISGLSQVKFGQKYGIPRRTIESWECDMGNPNFRPCPDYVRRLLERVVKEDFDTSSG